MEQPKPLMRLGGWVAFILGIWPIVTSMEIGNWGHLAAIAMIIGGCILLTMSREGTS